MSDTDVDSHICDGYELLKEPNKEVVKQLTNDSSKRVDDDEEGESAEIIKDYVRKILELFFIHLRRNGYNWH